MLVPAKSTLGGSGSTTANALATTTTSVNVSNAVAPVAGQAYIGDGAGGGSWDYPFAMRDDWANAIKDHSASGVLTSTTTASSTVGGSLTVYLTDASTFKASQGISIVGAGAGGVDHTTTIASVNTASNYVVLNVATVTTVGSGAVIYHDDTVSLQSLLSDSAKYGGYLPSGNFIISDSAYDAILAMTKMGKVILGNGAFTGGLFYNNQWAYGIPKVSAIYVRNATKNAVHMGSSGTTLNGITFLNHSTITPTAGAAIVCGVQTDGGTVYESSSANYTRDLKVRNCEILGFYDGIVAWQDFQLLCRETNVISAKRYGLNVDRKAPYGGDSFVEMAFAGIGGGTGTGEGAAIFVNNSDWNRFVNPHSNANKYGFYHNLSTTSQGQQIVQGLIVDELTAGGYGVYVSGSTVQHVGDTFEGGRVYNSAGTGAAYFGANSRRNIMKNFQLLGGVSTITNLGTSNVISDNPVN